MQNIRKRTKATAIAFVLILTLTTSLVVLTSVNAQQPVEEWKTWIYCVPTPVTGVGQEMFIVYWIDRIPAPETDDELAAGQRGAYYDVTATITKPDNSEITIEFPPSDPVGGGYSIYTPDQVGTYTVVVSFPGNWRNFTYSTPPFYTPSADRWYMPSESVPTTFEVQTEPVERWPDPPLQNDYLMRPIGGPTHWGEIAGNYLGDYAQKYPPGAGGGATDRYAYGAAPGSAHILWTRQHYPSGSIMDERFDSHVYTLNHYQDVDFNGQLIVDGVIHYQPQYTAHWGAGNPVDVMGWAGLDLYTGEQLFVDMDAQRPEFGQIYLYNSPNQHGGFSYLMRTENFEPPEYVYREVNPYTGPDYFENVTNLHSRLGTATWEMIDAYTRNRVCYLFNVSDSGTQVYGKDGSVLFYDTDNLGTAANPDYYLTIWNSTSMPSMLPVRDPAEVLTERWQWRPQWGGHSNFVWHYRENKDAFHDGDTAFSLNVSIPNLQGPRNPLQNQTASIRAVRDGEYIVFGTTGLNDERGVVPCWLIAFSLEEGKEGTKLWETTITPPQDSEDDYQGVSFRSVYPEDEVVVFNFESELKWYVYDMMTGQKLWESEPENAYGYYGMYDNWVPGMLITSGRYGGTLTAYNIRTGDIIWKYIAEGAGTESPYGNSIFRNELIAGDKIYLTAGEHSGSSPLWRGPNLRCVDIGTGEEIWKILFWGGSSGDLAVSDGILVGFNWYDGQVYAFGRGPSAITVTAPNVAVPLGTPMVIRGTVTDQTPTGRRNINNELQFSLKGTPAISDEDMQAWMEYKFMGQAYPEDAKGVEVVLSVVDSNNNEYEIGKTTSDINGLFTLTWEPPIEGDYAITATFEGSESYGPSSASTSMTVVEAPSPGQPQETEPPTTVPPTTAPPTTEPPTTEPPTTEPPTTEPPPTGEAPLITTEVAIAVSVAVAAIIGVAAYWTLRRRQVK